MGSDSLHDWVGALDELVSGLADPEPTLPQTQRLIDLVFGPAGAPDAGLPETERAAAIEYYLRRAAARVAPQQRVA